MEHIAKMRAVAGVTQMDLSNRLGVTQGAVARFEKPGNYPAADKLPAIADALGCSIDALYGRTSPDNTIVAQEGA